MWNYRESNKSDYPYGYSFRSGNVGVIGSTAYDFYLKKDHTAIIFRDAGDEGYVDGVFEKQ
jgi:hypothetical protein